MKGGNDMFLGVVILIVLIAITIAMPKGNLTNTSSTASTNSTNNNSYNSTSGSSATISSNKTPSVYIGTGNASYVYQPYEEYITLDNSGSNPVDITGWQLKNGKDKRAYDIGGTLRFFPSDTAVIGQAAPYVSPSGTNALGRVVLQSGETAIITTGSIGSASPYKIVSFKENICSGYLEEMSEYTFTPQLSRNCPRPADEPGINMFDTECRRFIERMSPCRTPEFDTRDNEGEICYGCVDGQLLSRACVAFIKNHFNYNSCIANHARDKNFSGRTWRIFLGKTWEMWAKEYETIELFDQLGRSVYKTSY